MTENQDNATPETQPTNETPITQQPSQPYTYVPQQETHTPVPPHHDKKAWYGTAAIMIVVVGIAAFLGGLFGGGIVTAMTNNNPRIEQRDHMKQFGQNYRNRQDDGPMGGLGRMFGQDNQNDSPYNNNGPMMGRGGDGNNLQSLTPEQLQRLQQFKDNLLQKLQENQTAPATPQNGVQPNTQNQFQELLKQLQQGTTPNQNTAPTPVTPTQ